MLLLCYAAFFLFQSSIPSVNLELIYAKTSEQLIWHKEWFDWLPNFKQISVLIQISEEAASWKMNCRQENKMKRKGEKNDKGK